MEDLCFIRWTANNKEEIEHDLKIIEKSFNIKQIRIDAEDEYNYGLYYVIVSLKPETSLLELTKTLGSLVIDVMDDYAHISKHVDDCHYELKYLIEIYNGYRE
jgi:hypothetical protein